MSDVSSVNILHCRVAISWSFESLIRDVESCHNLNKGRVSPSSLYRYPGTSTHWQKMIPKPPHIWKASTITAKAGYSISDGWKRCESADVSAKSELIAWRIQELNTQRKTKKKENRNENEHLQTKLAEYQNTRSWPSRGTWALYFSWGGCVVGRLQIKAGFYPIGL